MSLLCDSFINPAFQQECCEVRQGVEFSVETLCSCNRVWCRSECPCILCWWPVCWKSLSYLPRTFRNERQSLQFFSKRKYKDFAWFQKNYLFLQPKLSHFNENLRHTRRQKNGNSLRTSSNLWKFGASPLFSRFFFARHTIWMYDIGAFWRTLPPKTWCLLCGITGW